MSMRLLASMGSTKFNVNFGADRSVVAGDAESPYDSRAGLRLVADGTVDTGEGDDGAIVYSQDGVWIIPQTGATVGDYEYRWDEVTPAGGGSTSTPPDTEGVWRTMAGGEEWTLTTITSGSKSWVFTIDIRETADTANTDQVQVTLTVEGVI